MLSDHESQGYIDSASIYSLVQVLSYKRPEECFNWAWESAVQVIAILTNTNHLRLAPSPDSTGEASGPYGELTLGISRLIRPIEAPQEIRQSAVEATKRWAARNTGRIQSEYQKMKTDEVNFSKWQNWLVAHEWTEHTQRHGALFDLVFARQISQVLNVPQDYLHYLWKDSRDQKAVAMYANKQPDEDDFRYTRDAFAISALLRGRYHENVARSSAWQIMHHPSRYPILASLKGKPRAEFLISNTEFYFSNIILAGAFAESPKNRIKCLVENISKVKEATLAEKIDLRPKRLKDISLDAAVDAVKKAGIRTYPQWIEEAIDHSFSLGVNLLSLFLIPLAGLITSEGTDLATRRWNPGKLVATALYERKGQLYDLAEAGPGRIDYAWR